MLIECWQSISQDVNRVSIEISNVARLQMLLVHSHDLATVHMITHLFIITHLFPLVFMKFFVLKHCNFYSFHTRLYLIWLLKKTLTFWTIVVSLTSTFLRFASGSPSDLEDFFCDALIIFGFSLKNQMVTSLFNLMHLSLASPRGGTPALMWGLC